MWKRMMNVKEESAVFKPAESLTDAIVRTWANRLQPGEPGYGLGWQERMRLGV